MKNLKCFSIKLPVTTFAILLVSLCERLPIVSAKQTSGSSGKAILQKPIVHAEWFLRDDCRRLAFGFSLRPKQRPANDPSKNRNGKLPEIARTMKAAWKAAAVSSADSMICATHLPTRFALAGGSLPVLAKILEHADLSLLMRYVHPSQSDMDRAMEWYNAWKTDGPQLEQMLLTGTDSGGKIPEVVRPLYEPPSVKKVVQTQQFSDNSRGKKK